MKKVLHFLDVIQMVEEFERAINSFHATKNVSIFITGSNSWLLSGELATLLSGRYVSFRVMPFRFQEMCGMLGVKKEEASEKEFMDYITWGVMPQRFYFKTEEETKVFMTDLYDSIVLKDIFWRGQGEGCRCTEQTVGIHCIELFADIFSNIDCQVF